MATGSSGLIVSKPDRKGVFLLTSYDSFAILQTRGRRHTVGKAGEASAFPGWHLTGVITWCVYPWINCFVQGVGESYIASLSPDGPHCHPAKRRHWRRALPCPQYPTLSVALFISLFIIKVYWGNLTIFSSLANNDNNNDCKCLSHGFAYINTCNPYHTPLVPYALWCPS